MVDRIGQLRQLERIARIKAERQLQEFAAFNAHMTAARGHVAALESALSQSYDSAAPLSLPEARTANAQAGRAARELRRADAEMERLLPRFEIARLQAARAFGRAEALLGMARDAAEAARRERY